MSIASRLVLRFTFILVTLLDTSTSAVMGWSKSSPPSSVLLNRDTLYSLDELRKESIHSYDTGEYDFIGAIQEAFADTLAIDPSELPRLDLLHLDPSCAAFDKDGSNNAINTIQLKWNSKRDKQHMERDAFSRFNDVYRRFVSNVIGPLMGGGEIIYQRAPGLRVQPPSLQALGKIHNDMDYRHQPSELNFWLPLTRTFANNTLWVESTPNKGDFHPLELEYGTFCKFYGNQCRHFTYPNNTNATRVSIDFRAVSSASGGHDPNFQKGKRRGPKANYENSFDVGGFYDSCHSMLPLPAIYCQ